MAWPGRVGVGESLAFSAHLSGRSGPWQHFRPGVSYFPADNTQMAISGASGTFYIAQSFTPATAFTASGVALKLIRVGSPTHDMVIELFATDGSGNPTGSVLATSTFNSANISSSATTYNFNFTTPYAVSAGTQYAVRLRRADGSTSATNYIAIRNAGPGDYADGKLASFSTSTGTWTQFGNDAWFAVLSSEGTEADLYGVFRDVTNNTLEVWKSTDGGQAWAEVDSANHPSIDGTSSNQSFDSYLLRQTIHIAYRQGSPASGYFPIAYVAFDLATETWGTIRDTGHSSSTDTSIPGYSIGVVATTDGDIFVFNAGSYSNMGAKDAVFYKKSTDNGASWGSAVQFSPALANHYYFRGAVEGVANVIHGVMYTSVANGQLRHITSGDVLGTVSTIGTGGGGTTYYLSPPAKIPRSGSTQVMNLWRISSTSVISTARVTSSDTSAALTITNTEVTTATNSYSSDQVGSVAGHDNLATALWPDSDLAQIWRDTDNGSGTWGTDSQWKSSLTSVTKVDAQPITVAGGDVGVFYSNDYGVIEFDGYPALALAVTELGESAQSAVGNLVSAASLIRTGASIQSSIADLIATAASLVTSRPLFRRVKMYLRR